MIQVKSTNTKAATSSHNPPSSSPYTEQQQQFLMQHHQKDPEATFLSVIRNCAETENIQGFVNEIHSVNLTDNLCEKILRTLLDSRMKDEPLANFLHNLLVLKPLSLDKLSYALAACASSGSLCSIRLLVSQHNADVNYPYNSGQQWFLPLFAVLEDVDAPNMIEVAQLLLTLGGNPVKCSPDGMSALELLDLRFIVSSSGQPPPAALKIKDIFQHSMVPPGSHYVSSGVPHHAMVQGGKRQRTHMNPLSQPHTFDEMPHDGMAANTRLYLHCAEEEKETLKQLGARWDGNRRQFYIPPGSSITPFETWLPPLQDWNGVPREERVYLLVPETDKELVIQLGAQYDATHHRWYVPSGVSLQQFEPWLPKTENFGPPTKRMKLDMNLHG